MKKPGGLAVIIANKAIDKKSEKKDSEKSDLMESVGEEILSAIKSEDAKALSKAICNLCESYK